MRLFGSEMTRLASRRLFRWVLVLFIAGLVLAGVLVFVNDDQGTFTRSAMYDGLQGLSFPLLMFGWLVGASSIGAEWGNRTVSALLTWEPRRARVLLTKATATTVSTAVWIVALEIVWTAVMLPVASGNVSSFDRAFSWSQYAQLGGRIVAVSLVVGLLGFALATIGRNTGAALGGGMAYLLIVESLVRAFRPAWNDWLLSTNIFLVIEPGTAGIFDRSTAEAGGVLALYSAGLLLVALWFFRRREMA
jgi:ABC-type transport system involved in multi-copper enzyme maturation permease subunit